MDFSFYKGKRVLVTGHTGFKGSWLCCVLSGLGADVTGYSLSPSASPSLFELSGVGKRVRSVVGDIRNLDLLKKTFPEAQPEIVLHLAAQPIVRESYDNPVYTYDTNVMGTVNVLECVRLFPCVKSFLNVTTDKVYENINDGHEFSEEERLAGFDPYSNSKSCSELVTSCYKNSFFKDSRVAVSTARAGNAVGGGDFSACRIIPDCVRAMEKGTAVSIRNPHSVRPYQHVLESVYAYLLIAMMQYDDIKYSGSYNIGPDRCDYVSTGRLVEMFSEKCHARLERTICNDDKNAPYEADYLKLDCTRIKNVFDWKPVWNIDKALDKVAEWTIDYLNGGNICTVMDNQIEEYEKDFLKCMNN